MQLVDLNLIDPAEGQPRKTFYDDTLSELAQSIKERGVLEPIVVRPTQNGRYQIVMGERRCRAGRMAGLEAIPAIIRELSDEDATTDALLENFQREDLNPVERAQAIQDLLTGRSQDPLPVVTAMAKADLSFKLLLGVRNKVIEAYKQTINMQV